MIARDAIATARHWVDSEWVARKDFLGAIVVGSAAWLDEDADLPACSDVDIKICIDADNAFASGKRVVDGLVLDVSPIAADVLSDVENVLNDFQLAPAFDRAVVIADPSGRIAPFVAQVRRQFAHSARIQARIRHAQARVDYWCSGVAKQGGLHDAVTACQFGAGGNAHIVLTGALQNPTVRRRYASCAEVLAARDCLDVHEDLLTAMGAQRITQGQAQAQLVAMADAFDIACAALVSPYRFARDMTLATRPIAVDGAAEMIAQGHHRESMFWIIAGFSRARAVIARDAPQHLDRLDRNYWGLLNLLGFYRAADLQARVDLIKHTANLAVATALEIAAG